MHSTSPFLKTGTTLASFQFCRKEPVLHDLLNSLQRDGAITEAVSLGSFAGILSCPVAFVTSRASNTDWTALTVGVKGEAGEGDTWAKTDALADIGVETRSGIVSDLEFSFNIDQKRFRFVLRSDST